MSAQEHNDALLAVLLAAMTKGLASANDLADIANLAYDKPSTRRRQP